jgi:hypothetical protein
VALRARWTGPGPIRSGGPRLRPENGVLPRRGRGSARHRAPPRHGARRAFAAAPAGLSRAVPHGARERRRQGNPRLPAIGQAGRRRPPVSALAGPCGDVPQGAGRRRRHHRAHPGKARPPAGEAAGGRWPDCLWYRPGSARTLPPSAPAGRAVAASRQRRCRAAASRASSDNVAVSSDSPLTSLSLSPRPASGSSGPRLGSDSGRAAARRRPSCRLPAAGRKIASAAPEGSIEARAVTRAQRDEKTLESGGEREKEDGISRAARAGPDGGRFRRAGR